MAHYDLEEQEQIANLKTWWSIYGNLVTGIICIVGVAILAWQGWNYYQNKTATEANAIFNNMFLAFEKSLQETSGASKNSTANAAVVRIAGELEDKFANTGYATMAALIATKTSVEKNDLKTAKSQLDWLIKNSVDQTLIPIAKLRLANILLDEKKYDDALKILANPSDDDKNFLVSFYDLQGDIYLQKQDIKNARKFWELAKTEIDTHDYTIYGIENNMSFMRSTIEDKLNEFLE